MTKYSSVGSGFKQMSSRNRIFDVEPFSRKEQMSLTEVRDGLRLKRALKRAIGRDSAPQRLVDSILSMIRE
ncbi:MAG: hypothetical protein JNK51_07430 [Blastocatellia bacterium]|nr:hypothetical protein [Chloracidobacterium sp.]MBL8184741.1 hypothetical protein [Blastocatellia bacterium]HRJ90116.1 hypothetical protein [Pyrinomonadaceae bacterium]HRK49331.1 hypothetical protein [Pyrinomonadaceae bacterium]